MQHLITDDMIASAASALGSHGKRRSSKSACICGHDATPLNQHVAQVVADTISPSLTREVMALLSELMGRPAQASPSSRSPG